MTDKLDIFLTEARRNYDITVSEISSYDKKLSQVFTMCTAILGILLIGVSLLFTTLQNHDSVLIWDNIFVKGWLGFFGVTLFTGLYAFILCLKGLKLQEFISSNPKKLYENYNQKNVNEVEEFLIVQLGSMYEKNLVISKQIKVLYRKSLNSLKYSATLTIFLFILTLYLLKTLIMI